MLPNMALEPTLGPDVPFAVAKSASVSSAAQLER